MDISYHDYSDQNDHGYQYYHGLVKMCWRLELGGIPVHTEYRCLFFLRYEFLKYRNTGVI